MLTVQTPSFNQIAEEPKRLTHKNELIKMKLRTEFQKEYYPQVIEIYQRTGYSGYKIAKMKLLPVSKSVMCEWIASYEASKGNGSKRRIIEAKKEQAEAEVEALKSRISDLEEALRIERLRNQLNEKIIDIAEQRWHIEIRKKAGTKQ